MKKKILYTGGSFDLFHAGHVNFLRQCRELAEVVVVSLNTDAFIERFKRKPVMTYEERRIMLLNCPYVDAVVKNVAGFTSVPAIEVVDPDIIAIGDDWYRRDYLGQLGINQEFLDHHNIKLVYLPYTKGISTTELLNRIKA